MKLKFNDLRKIKRGDPLPAEANKMPFEAVLKFNDENLVALFKEAELKRWYGDLFYPIDAPKLEFKFRCGVCQTIKSFITNGKALFRMNIINDAVDFGREKSE